MTNQQQAYRTNSIQLSPSDGQPGAVAGAIFGAPTSRNALQPPRSYRFTGLIRF